VGQPTAIPRKSFVISGKDHGIKPKFAGKGIILAQGCVHLEVSPRLELYLRPAAHGIEPMRRCCRIGECPGEQDALADAPTESPNSSASIKFPAQLKESRERERKINRAGPRVHLPAESPILTGVVSSRSERPVIPKRGLPPRHASGN